MEPTQKTVFYDRHISLGAKMVEFGGWEMPLQYESGIVQEHLATRKEAGLFDISHMGRFHISGTKALPFLQHILSNNAAALEVGQSQYTIIPNVRGGAIDDAYLYRFFENEFLLVVNAANRLRDWNHLQTTSEQYDDVHITDLTVEQAMLSLQGPLSKNILQKNIGSGQLPEPLRNHLSINQLMGAEVLVARTGYTGEPIGFELFIKRKDALKVWDLIVDQGARPIGLGARDTLRLEAGLPLYGHELGFDPEGKQIPIFAMGLARLAVSFSPLKGDFIGRTPLELQFRALKKIIARDYRSIADLPRMIQPVALKDKGIARSGDKVFRGPKHIGFITSGTMVPFWKIEGHGLASRLTDEKDMRAIGLALIDSVLNQGDDIEIDVRGKKIKATIVPYHLKSEAPPYARAIVHHNERLQADPASSSSVIRPRVHALINKTIANTIWRQQECFNLIPSEQTLSPLARLLAIMDPSGRYAEHRKIKAFCEAEVFYYQGTEFIAEIETLLQKELGQFMGCARIETRLISGQMANTAVFSALMDYLNRCDRKKEPNRIRKVLNHHIIKGGHLSAQPMGALRDFVARDPRAEKPAVVHFPVLKENPYQIDLEAGRQLIAEHRPELLILGKSMMLHPEPVADFRSIVDELNIDCVIMYDMAHVLGLIGPFFQQPFKEGADIVTGSTHKTFFGTQRGIVAADYAEADVHYPFWEAIERRAFPGSVSNHHPGTLLGLLMAAYEMNHFKDEYQQQVLANAKAFALALKRCGLDVAGDPDLAYTQTHQVILNVGYAQGPEIARRLEENNIIVNYQATFQEEGFTAAGSLRMGVAEMTRFGLGAEDFEKPAQMISEVIKKQTNVKDEVAAFRKHFLEMKFCFSDNEFDDLVEKLHRLI